MKDKIVRLLVGLLTIFVLLLSGCVYDPLETNLNTRNIYPNVTNTYDVGSLALQFDQGYFREIYLNGVLLVPGGGVTGVTATLPITSTGGAIPDIGINYDAATLQVVGGVLGVIPGAGEIDPVFTVSPAFGITALNIADWNAHPGLTTGIHGVGAGNVTGTTLTQELTNKTLTSSVGKGTWTASGTWKLPAMFFNGDITTDRWLSTDGNTFLGVGVVGAGNLAHTGGSEGYYNTAIGYYALYNLTTSYFNTAVGAYALSDLTTGIYNTAVGQLALGDVATGNFNTAVGMQALTLNTGSYNTALGLFAGASNVVGDSNVFLGASAGKSELGSNKLYIDVTDTATPLIYGDFSTNDLTIYGGLHVSADVIDLSQIAVEPASTANRAGIYAWDLSADNATIGFFTEQAVETALGIASENRIPIRWNGNTYYLLAENSTFKTPIVNTIRPTVEQGLKVGIIFYNLTTEIWEKCTSISPVTWVPLSSGGATAWGSITGNITAQTDLQGALDGKLSTVTGTALDNVFSSNGLLKRTGSATYTVDNSTYLTSYTETDPVVKALTGIIKSNGSTISAITDNSSNWNTAFGWGNHASAGYLTPAFAGSSNITTVGIITSGTWNGTVLAGQFGGTGVANTGKTLNFTTVNGTLAIANGKTLTVTGDATIAGNPLSDPMNARGDIIVRDATNTTARLALGIANKFLSSNGTDIKWSDGLLAITSGKTLTVTDTLSTNTNSVTFAGTEVLTLAAAKNVTFADAFSTSGAFPLVLISSAASNVTFPAGAKTLVATDVATLSSLSSVGTITTGTWNGTVLAGQFGGTGIANTGKTITLVGSLSTTGGTSTLSFTLGGNTAVTLPTSGTLLTANQNITLSSDASGSGATSIAVTNTGLKGVALPTLATGYLYYNGSAWVFQTPAGGTHNLLDGSTHPDTTLGTVARGDLVTGQTATPKWTKLVKGSANQVLSMDATGTDVVWATPTGGSSNPPLYNKLEMQIIKNQALATVSVVGIIAPTLTATAANADDANGRWLSHATTNVANNPSGVISALFTILRRDWEPEYITTIKTDPTAITSLRYWVGLFSASPDLIARGTGTIHLAAFSYDTGLADTAFWRATTSGGVANTFTTTVTSQSITANTKYLMRIVCNTVDIKFYINDVLVATHNTNMPTSTQLLGYGNRVTTLTTAIKYIKWGRIAIRTN